MTSPPSQPPAQRTRYRDSLRPALMPQADTLLRLLGVRVDPDDPRIAALEAATHRGDPLADALAAHMQSPAGRGARGLLDRALAHGVERVPEAPTELRALFEQLDHEPHWLDREKLAAGARTVLRHSADGLCALAGLSLMSSYLSTAGTKPLIFTGALESSVHTRLVATGKLTHDIVMSDMTRFSEGFATAVRVRVMHALVRRSLSRSERWKTAHWGVPINQRDMLATHLQFTVTYLFGVLSLGRLDTAEEREGLMHLWRYVSYLLGLEGALVPTTFREGVELSGIINLTEPGPDDDGRRLARALTQAFGGPHPSWVARAQSRFMLGYSRYTLGRQAADALALPDTAWKRLPPVLALLRLPSELVQLASPRLRARAVREGHKLVRTHHERVSQGHAPRYIPYDPPQAA